MISTLIDYFAVTREISRSEDLIRSLVAGLVAVLSLAIYRAVRAARRGVPPPLPPSPPAEQPERPSPTPQPAPAPSPSENVAWQQRPVTPLQEAAIAHRDAEMPELRRERPGLPITGGAAARDAFEEGGALLPLILLHEREAWRAMRDECCCSDCQTFRTNLGKAIAIAHLKGERHVSLPYSHAMYLRDFAKLGVSAVLMRFAPQFEQRRQAAIELEQQVADTVQNVSPTTNTTVEREVAYAALTLSHSIAHLVTVDLGRATLHKTPST